jgi:Cupin superfamily protein
MADSQSAVVPGAAAPSNKSDSTSRDESLALASILSQSNVSIRTFFDSIWQNQCAVFVHAARRDELPSDPYNALIKHGWNALVRLLESTSDDTGSEDEADAESNEDDDTSFRPLLFQRQVQVPPDLTMSKYGTNLFSAYLDGCSVVVNHSDLFVSEIADLCEDLQRSFPHAYANAYLTPPGLQAVPPHADDRDVLVVQVVGEKNWRVYQKIPIPHPYPHEQVGKDGFPVPPQVFDQVLVERTLRPGDVLYMPRGYVHEACASSDSLSFHVTVALATHDWTLAGCLSELAAKLWTSELDFRPAMHRDIGTVPLESIDATVSGQLQSDLDRAIHMLKEIATVETVHHRMKAKYDRHNQRAAHSRQERITKETQKKHSIDATEKTFEPSSGPRTASHVTLDTPLRCSTPDEKAHVVALCSDRSSPRGLHVRDEIYEPIMRILQTFREQSTKPFTMRALAASERGVCDLALLAFARLCVEQGALVVVVG